MANPTQDPFVPNNPAVSEAVSEGHMVPDAPHVEPASLGLTAGGWVGLSMLALLLILVWKGALKAMTGGLDSRIAAIRDQLDEAKTLRAEAEALREEYKARIANAEKDAEAMLENARHEADALVRQAEEDSKELIERRRRMADDKIAAAEREAIEDVRKRAATTATAASRTLIAQKHDAAADTRLTDELIAGI